jgi:hypothetical protein
MWASRCPGVVRSLQEGGDQLLTFFQYFKRQWKTLRTTNVMIERLNEEFRRRVKTQGSLQRMTHAHLPQEHVRRVDSCLGILQNRPFPRDPDSSYAEPSRRLTRGVL